MLILSIFSLSFQACADGAEKFSALLSFASNYFYRGYSKSNNNPTIRANVDYEHGSGLYLGTWLSWVNLGDKRSEDRSDVEFYPYAGFVYKLAEDVRVDASVSRYVFNDKLQGKYSDYNEYSLTLRYSDLLSASFSYADDAYHRDTDTFNYEVSARYPLTSSLETSAGIGYNEALHLLEYNTLYWNAGFTWYFHRFAAVDLRYVDFAWTADSQRAGSIELPYIDSEFLFSLTAGF